MIGYGEVIHRDAKIFHDANILRFVRDDKAEKYVQAWPV
jgi:hypothetical protein